MGNAPETVVNVTTLIDEQPIGSMVVQVGALCALVAFLDGLDSTSIGIAAPLISDSLHLSRAQLGPIFSAALLGAMLGALGFGPLADRFGRKRMLAIATLTFGVFTLATAAAESFEALLFIRFLAGIGLGGAPPCFIALASEYTPRAHRRMVTSLVLSAIPLGIIMGSLLNAFLISAYSWREIFIVGGAAPLAVFLALLIWLPESIRFLVLKDRNAVQVARIVSRIAPSLGNSTQIAVDELTLEGTPIRNLLSEGRAPGTVLLWVAFLTVGAATASVIAWAPAVMRDHGIPLARGAVVFGLSGLTAFLGAASAGWLIEKFGARAVLVPALVIGTLTGALTGFSAMSLGTMAADLAVSALLVGGVASAGLATLAAGRYPTAMRSTGVGWAYGMSRFGQVLAPLLVGLLVTMGWNLDEVFVMIAAAPFVGAVCVLLLGMRDARVPQPTA